MLLDEMLSPVIAEQLRDRGHEVEAITGSENVFENQGTSRRGPDPGCQAPHASGVDAEASASSRVAHGARRRSCPAVATSQTRSEHQQLSDPEVMDLARSEHRAVVTNNLVDFRPLHHEAITPGGTGHWGMVFISGNYRRARADTGGIVEALEAKLAEFPEDHSLVDGETWL